MVYLNSKEKRCDPIEWHINELEDVILDQAGDISKLRVDLSVGDLVEIKRQEEAVSKFYIVSEFESYYFLQGIDGRQHSNHKFVTILGLLEFLKSKKIDIRVYDKDEYMLDLIQKPRGY